MPYYICRGLERFVTISIYLAPVDCRLIITLFCLSFFFWRITLLASEINHLNRASIRMRWISSDNAMLAVTEVIRVQGFNVWA